MTATYDSLATTTLSSAASTITFNSIPGTFTDLRLILVAGGTSSDALRLRMNNDSGTNYSFTLIYGNGSTAASAQALSQTGINPFHSFGFLSSTLPALLTFDVFSYAGSTNKTCLVATANDRNGAGTVQALVGLWRNTAAITRLDLIADTSFTSGTTATLYGIKSE